jgi:hypothetical protein
VTKRAAPRAIITLVLHRRVNPMGRAAVKASIATRTNPGNEHGQHLSGTAGSVNADLCAAHV